MLRMAQVGADETYTIGSSPRSSISRTFVASDAPLDAGPEGFAGSKDGCRFAGTTVFQNSGTLMALAPAAAARRNPAEASGPVKTSGSTIAVWIGRGDAAAPLADAAARLSNVKNKT